MLRDHTTFRIGGPASRVIEARDEDALIQAVRDADAAGEPVLLIGGGSNLLISDDGFDGVAVLIRTTGITVTISGTEAAEHVTVTAAAGEPWDAFVERAVASGWVGIECLSGIPGSVGATPIQNVGAYGQEVSATIASVRVLDRTSGEIRSIPGEECGFAYRHSMFKDDLNRFLVLDVTFGFEKGQQSAPIAYSELARSLGVDVGQRAPLETAREVVLGLRRGKGMVLDAEDHDSWSAGSFFTNPIITAEQAAGLPERAPRFPQPEGLVKTSAAWLIDNAGFPKGFAVREGAPASLSTKHTLALTNRGGAACADVLELARHVRDGVERVYGVRLVNEPIIVGESL